MRRETLNALGIHMGDIDARILMDEGFNGKEYGLSKSQCDKVRALREFLQEYKGDISKPSKGKITCCHDAVELVKDSLLGLDHEELWCAFMNKANTPLAVARMTSGGIDSTPIDCRQILRKALLETATGLIIFHNHPGGDPHPGAADIKSTENLRNAAQVLEIALLDHIIVSDTQWFSFAEETVYKF